VLEGWGGDRLLDSYGEERRPIFVETGEAMIAGGIEADRAFLERYNPQRDREEFLLAWRELEATAGTRQQSYEPHYEGSSVVIGPSGSRCSIHGEHSFAARAGHHLTPQRLSSGRDVFEELGRGYTLLALGARDGAEQRFSNAAATLGLPLNVIGDTCEQGREAYESSLILVRPDQYVVWSGDEPPDNVAGLLRKVSGAV
jgi:hypothetical protein